MNLLDVVNFNPSRIRMVFLGDLGDRGPKSAEVVSFVRGLCEKGEAECVDGNHDNKHVRFRRHLIKKSLTGKDIPMRELSATDMEFHKKLTEEDISWMRKLPLKIHLKGNWWAIHAGCEPAYNFENQSPQTIRTVRYVSDGNHKNINDQIIPYGRAVSLNKDKTQAKNTIYWTDGWNGPQSIVYGHCVHSLHTPLIDIRPNGVKCIGIDTGCVFGGHLTCYSLTKHEFFRIKAQQEYYHLDVQFED